MKVVINKCYGGYSLSKEAIKLYIEKAKLKLHCDKDSYYTIPYEEYKKLLDKENLQFKEDRANFTGHESNKYAWQYRSIERHDPVLVNVIEELKEKANDSYSKLAIVEIPDDVEYTIQDYDGCEHIAEKHRTWG